MKSQDKKYIHKVSVHLTDNQYDELEQVANKTQLSYSQIMRYAFDNYLSKTEVIQNIIKEKE